MDVMKELNNLSIYKSEYEEYFPILDTLRDSGEINMFGAPRWLRDNFDLTREEASNIFTAWTKTH